MIETNQLRVFEVWKLILLFVLATCVGCGGGFATHDRAKTNSNLQRGDDFGGFAAGGVAEAESVSGDSDMRSANRGEPEAAGDAPPAPPAKPRPPKQKSDGTTGAVETVAPLLIYTANYTMAVFEVTQSIDAMQALAKKMGGYLVRRDDRTITVRVPAGKYTEMLGGITKMGDVLHREETVEDVTEQFFDMKTRLDNARAMRVRLQELLAAAKDVKDALAVERELARVTETIERLEGKLKRLRELINFSTITVTFSSHQSENVNSKVKLPFPWLNKLGLGELLRLN